VPVVVASHDLAAGTELRRSDLRVEQIPHRYAPRDAPSALDQAVGLRTAGPVAAGSPITAGAIADVARGRSGGLRQGERAVEVAVSGWGGLLEAGSPGTRVDVLVSTDPADGEGRTSIALEDVELLGLQPGPGAEGMDLGGAAGPGSHSLARAKLRVTLRQAVYLAAAQNYARELRLLSRPPGDRRRLGRASVSAGSL
jgi:pilus assembly protein CpaB